MQLLLYSGSVLRFKFWAFALTLTMYPAAAGHKTGWKDVIGELATDSNSITAITFPTSIEWGCQRNMTTEYYTTVTDTKQNKKQHVPTQRSQKGIQPQQLAT
jgi:hypothetical protein